MKVLFISHDDSRTGAPLILLHFLTWLKSNNKNINADLLVLKKEGVLLEDFKNVTGHIYNLDIPSKAEKFSEIVKKRIFKKFSQQIKDPKDILIDSIVAQNYDVIYGNTVISIPMATLLKKRILNSKVVIHIHELNLVINQMLPNFRHFINDIDLFIAASKKVKSNLVENYDIDNNLIEVVYSFSKIENTSIEEKSNNKFIVGGSGQVNWRKGYDLFIQVAFFIKKKFPQLEVEFIWVGKNWLSDVVKTDIEKAGLDDMINFVGEQDDPEYFYNQFDIFLMTSREDPFPLVCIEQAMLGTPILCFEQATGTEEILQNGGGAIIPYLDIEVMANKIKHYYDNPKEIENDGNKAKELFSEFTIENKCPELYAILNKISN